MLGAERLERRGAGYALAVGPDELDLERFEHLAAEGARALESGDAGLAAGLLREALGLWRGPALADVAYEDFASAAAERLEEARLVVLEQRIDADLALGRHEALVGELESLVLANPFRESVRRRLILALYRSDRQAEALDAYRSARQTLVDELGIDPSPALQALEQAILRQDPSLAAPEAAEARFGRGLPAPATALVGRTLERAAVGGLLRRPEVRLVTLTGPGGIGKTRLALAAAAEVSSDLGGPAAFVDLSPIRDPALVATTIVQALGLPERPDRPAAETLADELADVRLLLVLDNFEQVVESAGVVASLLAAAPRLTVLVTSRAPLRLAGEHEYAVPPLSLPAPGGRRDAETLATNEAVALFVARAQAIEPGFRLTDENAGAVTEICFALDGLPLALELAAARTRLLEPEAMLNRLERRLTLLTESPVDAPERHRTLGAAIEWSYGLLDERERVFFEGLSVFAGGFTLASVDAVCEADEGLLGSLLAKSLVRRVGSAGGEARFGMLETIREFAAEALDRSGRGDEVRRRHAARFVELAEASETGLKGPEQRRWSALVEAEHDNLRAALVGLLAGEDDESRTDALRLAAALGWFWYTHGHTREGAEWLEQALGCTDDRTGLVRARATHVHGILLVQQGEYDRSVERLEAGLAMFRELGDETRADHALNSLAATRYSRGDFAVARRAFEEIIARRRARGDLRHLSTAISNLGVVLLVEGELDGAKAALEEAIALDREYDDGWAVAIDRGHLASVTLELGDPVGAARLQHESLADLRELGDRTSVAEGLARSAVIAATLGEAERAARLVGAAERARDALGEPASPDELMLAARHLPRAREALGDEAYEAAVAEGRELSLAEAFDAAAGAAPAPSPAEA
ncbi:MAG TPA: BTAD domain-containing putative transcriptional regulator [Gaiellaceae bacterium]